MFGSRAGRPTDEERRRLLAEHQWALFGFGTVWFFGLMIVLDARRSAPFWVWLLLSLALIVGSASSFAQWQVRKLREMRAESRPSAGEQEGGERPGG